jgi:hypothetical protein
MKGIGLKGYYWSLIALHGLIAVFFVYRMRAWKAPLAKVSLEDASLPARAFLIPATVVLTLRRSRRR